MPPKERIKQRINEFEVFMNPEYWGQDCDSSAETFAGWAPEEEASTEALQPVRHALVARQD